MEEVLGSYGRFLDTMKDRIHKYGGCITIVKLVTFINGRGNSVLRIDKPLDMTDEEFSGLLPENYRLSTHADIEGAADFY